MSAGKLIYCSRQLARTDFAQVGIPAINGCAGITEKLPGESSLATIAQAFTQQAIDKLVASKEGLAVSARIEGPFGVPYVSD